MNPLDRDWTTPSLLRFALPTMVMMLCMGLYTLTDTLFVARLVNTDALSALNIVCPAINLTVGLGTMLAAGGNALVSRRMGAGDRQGARSAFTLLVLTGAALGLALLVLGRLWLGPILRFLGASDRLLPYCRDYLGPLLLFFPANLLQTLFASFFVTAGRPGLGFGLSLGAGLVNLLLDFLLMGPLQMGIRGAALGTGTGYLIPTLAGMIFFTRNKGALSFAAPRWNSAVLWASCANGFSEMVGQLSAAVTTFLFNRAMLRMAGEDGVAAITILIYAQFLLHTLYIGFSMGVSPVMSFQHGRGDRARQRQILRSCLVFLALASLSLFALAFWGGPWAVRLFAGDSPAVYAMAEEGFAVFSVSFLFCGVNLFTSALFTALSKGALSAALSFLRTFVLLSGGILLLPLGWGIRGVYLAVPAAEGAMFSLSLFCLWRYRNSL